MPFWILCMEKTNFNNGNLNTADKPIFKIEEILLNEAEAQYELNGKIEQPIIEATINKLRERAGVDKMIVADIDDSFDPNRGKYYPKDNDGNTICIGTHATPIRTFYAACKSINKDDMHKIPWASNASVTTAYYKNGKFEIEEYGYDSLSEHTYST